MKHYYIVFLLLLAPPLDVFGATLSVVATTPDLAAVVREVGGDRVTVKSIARPTEDPHFVDARPSFIPLLNRADALIEGGAQLEAGWLPPLLEASRNPKIAAGTPARIVASAGIVLREVPAKLDRAEGDVHPQGNPHFMLDPENAQAVASTIEKALCAIDAGGCDGYRTRGNSFRAAVDREMPRWQQALKAYHGAKVVTYHRDFDYFAGRFGIEVVDTLEPKPGIPPSPTHLATLVPKMKSLGVRAIIVEPNRESQNPTFVAEQTGARIVQLPIMPTDEMHSYTDFVSYLVNTLSRALAQHPSKDGAP